MRVKLQKVLDVLGSNQALRRLVAIDNVLERGPRLRQMSCFCDIRTSLTDANEKATGSAQLPSGELRVPIVIVRMKIDEVPQFLYFQFAASERRPDLF
jgi:hypothetical protein